MKKNISILGSTGSIGSSALSIIDKKKDYFKVILLSSNKNYKVICKQILNYQPIYFIICDRKIFLKAQKKFKKNKVKILNSFDDLNLKKKIDIVITAIPGLAGLYPTISIIKNSKKILIANKESIICGWHLIKDLAIKKNTKIIPVDSEHYSIFKLIENSKINEIDKIFITASGGPFLNYNRKLLKNITPKEALKHPKWKMGKKISIDSSTLMNKIFEFIEAQKLFNIPEEKLDIIIHPNSLVHAIVKFKNGLTNFIYHETSMVVPLANAIFDGDLTIKNFIKEKKKLIFNNLIFKKVDEKIFPVIKLKKRVNEFPATSIIINSANEVLVEQFLKKNIPFTSISDIIITILNNRNYRKYAIRKPTSLSKINKIDIWTRKITMELIRLKHD
jgi:1-deoxy-D-xylulose-5-phosphate reductoisomerase